MFGKSGPFPNPIRVINASAISGNVMLDSGNLNRLLADAPSVQFVGSCPDDNRPERLSWINRSESLPSTHPAKDGPYLAAAIPANVLDALSWAITCIGIDDATVLLLSIRHPEDAITELIVTPTPKTTRIVIGNPEKEQVNE